MGKSGPKLSDAKANKLRKNIRAIIKANKDLQAAVNGLKKSSKAKDNKAKLRSAISKVIVRNPLLQQAGKDLFKKSR